MSKADNTRNAQRKALREARRALTPEQQKIASHGLVNMVIQSKVLTTVKHCALYLANDAELDTAALINYCWQKHINTSLPVLHPFTAGHLLFLRYRANSAMIANKYGIPEPICELPNVVPLQQHDIVFTPLVGFDYLGNRLGMGGGYYDRTLAKVRNIPNIKLVGLAHDCQQVTALPRQEWDIPLDMIITPTQIINPTPIIVPTP